MATVAIASGSSSRAPRFWPVTAYSARDKKLHGINASGWAPAAWTPEYFRGLGFDETTGLPEDGVHSIKGDPRANGVYRAGSDLRKDGQAVGW